MRALHIHPLVKSLNTLPLCGYVHRLFISFVEFGFRHANLTPNTYSRLLPTFFPDALFFMGGVFFRRHQGVGQTTSFLGDSAAATAAAARIFSIVDRKPAINSADEGGQRLPAVKGRIELRCCVYCVVYLIDPLIGAH